MRVANRIGVNLLKVKGQVFTGAAIAVVLLMISLGSVAGTGLVFGALRLHTDCADTAMRVISDISEPAARAAYACFSPGMGVPSEDKWVQYITTSQAYPTAYRIAQDGELVFFSNHQGTGWIVHLDPDGKVLGVE